MKLGYSSVWLLLAPLCSCLLVSSRTLAAASNPDTQLPAVALVEDANGFTLDNGLLRARIDKRSGNLASLLYHGHELLGRGGGYWSFVGSHRALGRRSSSIVLDPKDNFGAQAEISCRFAYDETPGTLPVDVELHCTVRRGQPAVYLHAIWDHKPEYPRFSVGEARYAAKLNPQHFDFMTIDAQRRRLMPTGYDWDHGTPLNMKEVRRLTTGRYSGEVEHKYDYAAILSETPAYGWSSTSNHVGVWIINPSIEYLAGGPTKVELTGHLDNNPGGLSTLLNMWLGSHYGGSSLAIAKGETWTKLIGPFVLYCNSAPDHDQMWKDALVRAQSESARWPYDWLSDSRYPPRVDRGTVEGRIILRDPGAGFVISNLQVGLSAPDYLDARGSTVDWQRNAAHYQFWTRADANGAFAIPNARPGSYSLHAFADGVLGELTVSNITVRGRQTNTLGSLTWTPVRHGRTIWEIGIPDRTAREFRHGDDFWHWGLYNRYPEEFPEDVHFIIGKSDWRRDWNYSQPPRNVNGRISSTTWSIVFDLPDRLAGRAALRLAIAGSRLRRGIEVTVNGKPAGAVTSLPDTGVMHRDGIRGYWCERTLFFDAALLAKGTNTIQLHPPAQSWVEGVLYDYLRLEVDSVPTP